MVTSDILASGFYVARFGGEHGHPTTDNLSAIYYNPAGLSLGAGTRLTIDANLAWRAGSYERPEEPSIIHYRTTIRAKRYILDVSSTGRRYRIKLHLLYRCR